MEQAVYKFNDYQIINIIGKGTFGTVFLCNKYYDNKIVVLKEVAVKSPSDEKYKEIQNEINVLSALNHPFIIKYFDNFYENKNVYICMEYATNGNLAEYMYKRHHYLVPQNEILYFFCQIIIGVQHIHSKNIIHRDLKAENIFMSGPYGNVVKIGDFGIAKILDNDKTSSVIGTPYYLAPEICENKPYDCKTDIWALGCLLYEMCTHKRAFEASTLVGLVNQIITGNVMPINTCFYDREMQEVIDCMLTVVPDKRCNINELLQKKILIPSMQHFAHVDFFSKLSISSNVRKI